MVRIAANMSALSVGGRFVRAMKKVWDGAAHSNENLVSNYET
jgi:hypothetical protein